MTEPVQKHLTPSSFQLIIHPTGSRSSLQCSASSTLIQPETGDPRAVLVSTKLLSQSLAKLLSLLAEEVALLLCDIASLVMAVIESTFPLLSLLGLVPLLSDLSSSMKVQMNLWFIALYPSLLSQSSSLMHSRTASSFDPKCLYSIFSAFPFSFFVSFILLSFTSIWMLSPPVFSQYYPLKDLNFLSFCLLTADSFFSSSLDGALYFNSLPTYPLVSLSLIFWITLALAAAQEAQSFQTVSQALYPPPLFLPTLKVTDTPLIFTSQNLSLGWIRQTGLDRSTSQSQITSIILFKVIYLYHSVEIYRRSILIILIQIADRSSPELLESSLLKIQTFSSGSFQHLP